MNEFSHQPKPPQDVSSPEVTADQLDQFDAEVRKVLELPTKNEADNEDDVVDDHLQEKAFVRPIKDGDLEAYIKKTGPEKLDGPETRVELTYTYEQPEGGRLEIKKEFVYDLSDLTSSYFERAKLFDRDGKRIPGPAEPIMPQVDGLSAESIIRYRSALHNALLFKEQVGDNIFNQSRFNEVMGVLTQLTPEDEIAV